MKPIIIKESYVPILLSIVIRVGAITLWPFIFIRKGMSASERLIRHESIHIQQYTEMLVLGFYPVYVWDWLHGLIKYRSGSTAYMQIRMEQEAYENEGDEEYLKNRKRYAWLKYKV
tara:strand:- start:671 stop:1018 length:348 start_codon:yes stop_codon:yes gene_type:complete